MDLFSIGEMVIDFIPGEQEHSYIRMAGGAPANVAIAVARNGLEAGFCGKVGNDIFGKFLTETLAENKVAVLCKNPAEDAMTTMAFVTLEDGERSFSFARKPGADTCLSIPDICENDIMNSRMIHAGSFSLSREPVAEVTRHVMKMAYENKKIVSFDVNYRGLAWDDDKEYAAVKIFEVLPYVDLLKVSEDEIDLVGGTNHLFALMAEYQITAIVVTSGQEGARCYWNSKILFSPAYRGEVVDTTGAGDAFWGGFLSEILRHMPPDPIDWTEDILLQAMKVGNIAGGLCVQKKGAISALPTRTEIEAKFEL